MLRVKAAYVFVAPAATLLRRSYGARFRRPDLWRFKHGQRVWIGRSGNVQTVQIIASPPVQSAVGRDDHGPR